MLGILLGLSTLVGKCISSNLASIDDRKNKQWWIEKNASGECETGTWVDRKGCERDLRTNEIMHTRRSLSNGDKIVEDSHGRVVRNLSQEKRYQEYINAKKNPLPFQTVVKWDFPKDSRYGACINSTCFGQRYKDLETGRLYVARTLGYRNHSKDFFMDVETGRYVRPTDFDMYYILKSKDPEKEMQNAREILREHLNFKQKSFDLCGKYDNAKESSCALAPTNASENIDDKLFSINF